LCGVHADQWLKTLEQSTTNTDGTAEVPSCGVIESVNCYPFKDCRVFTPPEFYYIRYTAGAINQYFTRFHESLQDSTLLSSLRINDIIADFRPAPEITIDPNTLRTAGSAFSMADKIVKQGKKLGPAGDFLGFIGGLLGLVAANVPGAEVFDIEGVRTAATNHLAEVFTETQSSTEKFLARLFGDTSVDYSLPDLITKMKDAGFQPISDSWDSTAVIMALPWMGGSDSVGFTEPLRLAVEQMNHGLIGAILKGMGRLVVVLKDKSSQEACDMTGSRWIDGQCFMVSRGEIDGEWRFLEAEYMNLFDGKYGIDLAELYKNVKGCATESGGGVDVYPSCFIGMDYQEIYSCPNHSCEDDRDCESECFDGCDYRFQYGAGLCRYKQ
jgi:hypothetical protein